jgi:hypothetical protein
LPWTLKKIMRTSLSRHWLDLKTLFYNKIIAGGIDTHTCL